MENNINIVPDELFKTFLPEDDWMDMEISGNLLNLDDELETPDYTIQFNGARIGPVTGVQTIAGQSGHGKTQLMTLLMAAYLGAAIEGIKNIWKKQSPIVLYVDTEMEKGNTQLVVARISRLCDTQPTTLKERLHVLRLRDEEDHANIWRKILKAVFQLKPDVLFLDGMIDIIGDFNDNKEAHVVIRKVMKLADHYEIPIWTVMHQNPGSTKMTGHQGSFLERKATAVLFPVKVWDDEQQAICHFEIKNGKQRGEDIVPLSFHMERFTLPNGETNAYPVIGKNANSSIDEKPKEPDYAAWVKANIPQGGITTRDLRETIKKEFKIGGRKADELMWKLEDEKYVMRDANKRYHIGATAEAQDLFKQDDEQAPF